MHTVTGSEIPLKIILIVVVITLSVGFINAPSILISVAFLEPPPPKKKKSKKKRKHGGDLKC